LTDKKTPSNMGPRLIVECSPEFKAKVEQIATERGFTSYKNYIVAVINNDIDRLTKPVKQKKGRP